MEFDWIVFQSGMNRAKSPLPQTQPTTSEIFRKKVSLTAAQIKAIGTTPIDIIPAQGVGTVISIISMTFRGNWGTVAFDSNTLDIGYDGGATWRVNGGFFVSFTANTISHQANYQSVAMLENTKMVVIGTDSVATGDSTVDVYITYEIITV